MPAKKAPGEKFVPLRITVQPKNNARVQSRAYRERIPVSGVIDEALDFFFAHHPEEIGPPSRKPRTKGARPALRSVPATSGADETSAQQVELTSERIAEIVRAEVASALRKKRTERDYHSHRGARAAARRPLRGLVVGVVRAHRQKAA